MALFDNTMILTDLDGTLLNSDAEISPKNAEAVRYYMDNGGKFSFATGRNITGMKYFMKDIPSNAPGVVSNGAVVYDFPNDRMIKSFPLGKYGEELAEDLLQTFPDVGIEVLMPDGPYLVRETPITDHHMRYTKMTVHRVPREEIAKPWLHMLLTREPAKIGELEKYVNEKFGDRIFFQYSAEYFLEALIKGVNKGTTALYIADMLHIPKNGLYTAGDGRNDVQLVSCSENGFAPQNAHEDILALNPQMLPDNDHDAIAALIEIIESRVKK